MKKSCPLPLHTAFETDYCNKQEPVENKNTPKMHRNHVPLNCTDRTIAHIPSLAFLFLPSPPASHGYPFFGGGGWSWFGCVTGRAGFSSLQEEKGAG